MYNFDGEYKRNREQNLAGASKLSSGKEELINRAHKERMKRQADRKKEISAIRIQKIVRGFLCRLKLKKKMNSDFGEGLRVCENRQTVPADVQYLIARLHVLSRGSLYKANLEKVTRKALSISNELIQLASRDSSWVWRLNVLLTYALEVLSVSPVDVPLDSTVLLMCDALDTFTALNNNATPITIKKILFYLLHNNYMLVMRDFLSRLHSYQETVVRSSPEEIKNNHDIRFAVEMITRPVTLLTESDDAHYRDRVLDSLCKMITADPCISVPVKEFILPFIKSKQDFPLQYTFERFLSYANEMNVPSALYFFLAVDKDQTAIAPEHQGTYFRLLAFLTRNLTRTLPTRDPPKTDTPDFEDLTSLLSTPLKEMLVETLNLLNTPARSAVWMNVLKDALASRNFETIIYHSTCVLHIMLCDVTSPYNYRIIKDLWFAEGWLRGLWVVLESQMRVQFSGSVPLLALLKRGTPLTKDEAIVMLPLLAVFCSFLFATLSFITDEDLLKPDIIMTKAVKPFTVNELIYIASTLKDAAVGLIVLGYPDNHVLPEEWIHSITPTDDPKYNNIVWFQTLMECIKVVREVYYRNERCQIICDTDWHSFLLAIPDNSSQFADIHDEVGILPPFCTYPRTHMVATGRRIGTWYDKACTLLTSLPFTISFGKRYRMLWNVINAQMYGHQNPDVHFLHNPHLSTTIRRDYLYEDAFDKLSIDNAPELRIAVRIRFTNTLSMDEAGIDGGGIFREFVTDLLKTAFDPNRGFFILTKDNKLFPNPNVSSVYPNFTTHYFFIGRILAKAIFENIVVDIPLAEFFLAKVIDSASLYPSLLHTLDKDLFRNVSYLRTYSGDLPSLGLDFTTTTNSFGSSEVIELKPNGSEIPVNEENVVEYIHLISKRKLHLDISKQTRAFTKGLGHVLPLHILRMFTPREIQLIISGGDSPIDLNDMKKNVIYSGGYSASHQNIHIFWKVCETFNDEERSQLLRFVTSCSRPPLRGFKDLHPPFCIQLVEGVDNRLPTSSTCMNILKLPLYTDESAMREKLLYAIQSGAGFELS